MKPLLIILALTICTGFQFVRGDESATKLAKLKEEIDVIGENISDALKKTWVVAAHSELGQMVYDYLSRRYSKAKQLLHTLEDELPTDVSQTYDLVVGIPTGVAEKAINILKEVREKLKPHEAELVQLLESLEDPIPEEELYLERVRDVLLQISEGLDHKLNERLEKLLQDLIPYAKDVQHQLQQEDKDLEPYVDLLREHVRAGVEKVSQFLQRFLVPHLKPFQEHKKEFKQWVDATVLPPQKQ